MGNKTCPMCGESIHINLKACPHCSEQFDTTAPISLNEIRQKYAGNPEKIPEMKTAVWIFIIALLGITAPLILIFAPGWHSKNKRVLIDHSPIHNLLVIMSLIVSGFYMLLFVLAIVFNV